MGIVCERRVKRSKVARALNIFIPVLPPIIWNYIMPSQCALYSILSSFLLLLVRHLRRPSGLPSLRRGGWEMEY